MSGGDGPHPKHTLREELLSARLRLSPDERAARSRAASARLVELPAFHEARTIGVYAAIGAEADPAGLTRAALAAGKRVAFPRLVAGARVLSFAACAPQDLVAGERGTRQPPPGAPEVPLDALDLVVVPGVAFDPRGGRLGRGGGYYDATLAGLPAKVVRAGLAFDLQVVPEVPGEPHDATVHLVATDERLVWAAPAAAGSR